MEHLLPERLAWYIAGPLMGLCVATLYAAGNGHLGVSGAYLHALRRLSGKAGALSWRLWFLGGLAVGALAATLLRGDWHATLTYGVLAQWLPVGLLVPVLFASGLLMGFGARWSGGCTSGHGLTGCSLRSPGSLAATATFMATGVAVTWAVHLLSGGAV
ncbi:MAG TPA: YeeE/YedE thiosulfate transporter family protein [Limnochordia bacterium]|nr:YeeE/YedE thiosulfate transporter family protein [Limnochordia bacterium]